MNKKQILSCLFPPPKPELRYTEEDIEKAENNVIDYCLKLVDKTYKYYKNKKEYRDKLKEAILKVRNKENNV